MTAGTLGLYEEGKMGKCLSVQKVKKQEVSYMLTEPQSGYKVSLYCIENEGWGGVFKKNLAVMEGKEESKKKQISNLLLLLLLGGQ